MARPIPPRTREFFYEQHPDDRTAAKAEWLIYKELQGKLDNGWVLFSHVIIRRPDRRNVEQEIDILLLHPRYGIVLGEVKSRQLHPEKIKKASKQYEDGRDFLKKVLVDDRILGDKEFRRLKFFLACPDVKKKPNRTDLSPYFSGHEVIVEPDLDSLSSVIEDRICGGPEEESLQLGTKNVEAIIKRLSTEDDMVHADEVLRSALAQRADLEIAEQVRNLISLDLNLKVFVDGGAGTGKTWLATEWVRKAATSEGEQQVLFTCYNEALADAVSEKVGDLDRVTVGAFLRHVEKQLEKRRRDAKPKENLEPYWEELMTEAAAGAEPALGRFDVIVVDEIQDFEVDWIEVGIPWLLKDGGKLLAVGDLNQNVRKNELSYLLDGSWTRAMLTTNLRNPASIARFAERFGGAPGDGPDALADEVKIIGVRDEADFLARIMPLVASVPRDQRQQTWVLTSSRGRRELLQAQDAIPQMVPWGKKSEGVVCVTAQHVKGLETPHIVLVILEAPDSDAGLDEVVYAGATRSTATLTIITTQEAKKMLDRDEVVEWGSALWPKLNT